MSIDGRTLPQLKHTSPVYGTGDTVYIGGFGETTEIPDPTGIVRRMLELLDGKHTIREVHSRLSEDFTGVTLDDVAGAIKQFDEAGFLLNGAATPESILEDFELRRWERNINFFGSFARLSDNKYDQQRKLRDCRVALLGLGGLGSHILLDMAAMGIGHVRAVEFDRVEISNLNRQILYRESDIGAEKLYLAAERVREFNPHMSIEPVSMQISSTQDVYDVIEGTDVVILVADRPKMEIVNWVNAACVARRIPLITGGLETQRAVYYSVVPGVTGCVECWRQQVFATDEVSRALLEEKTERRIGGDNAAFCPLVTMTTGLLIGELTRLITGIAPLAAAGRLMELRFSDYLITESEQWSRRDDCPVCGPGAVVPGISSELDVAR